jgi:lipopolysaccharide/colanic/teichoic acid biosynthesis glycosyltransferase
LRSVPARESDKEIVWEQPGVADWQRVGGASYAVKGIIDRAVSWTALAVLAIPMLGIAVAVRATSTGPALVRQERVGRYGRTFIAYKFRSMRQDAEMLRDGLENGNNHDSPTLFKMRRDPRVTRVGRLLRRTSLDELPQLINVARGDMSLVGPRPPLPREVMHYEPRHLQRLAVTPGLTGLWQVRGRSELPFEEMVSLDLEYIERWSLWLDLAILLRTPAAVVGGRGAW